jgi:transcriptional regulator with XRE-family HTH domain
VTMHETEFRNVNKQEEFPKKNFSDQFSHLIRESTLSQKEIAQALGIAESAIVNYKRGRTPSGDALFRIARYFNVSMEWLMTGHGYQTVEEQLAAVMDHQRKIDPDLEDSSYKAAIEKEMRREVEVRDAAFPAYVLEAKLASSERKLKNLKLALRKLIDEN